jgi:hypothetical protein
MRNAKDYNHLSYISFKIAPLCNYTLLPANVTVEKHLWKPFCESLLSSYVAFLMMLVTSQKLRPFSADFQPKTAAARSGECGGYSSVVTLFFAN